jgi:hypothetical protein
MARPVVLGIDCALYFMPTWIRESGAEDSNLALTWDAVAQSWGSGAWEEIEPVTQVTLNMTTSEADVTTRASNGWRQVVPTLKDASVDFSILWQPDDALFADLLKIFIDQCPMSFLILDGTVANSAGDEPNQYPTTSVAMGDPGTWTTPPYRCTGIGDRTGLWADFAVMSFTRNEALEEAVMADISIRPTVGLVTPEWITIAENATP